MFPSTTSFALEDGIDEFSASKPYDEDRNVVELDVQDIVIRL
jgi:hypothetical protein